VFVSFAARVSWDDVVRPPSQIRARRGDPSPLRPKFESPSRSGHSIASSTERPAVKASSAMRC
jgi:hypothetical protein